MMNSVNPAPSRFTWFTQAFMFAYFKSKYSNLKVYNLECIILMLISNYTINQSCQHMFLHVFLYISGSKISEGHSSRLPVFHNHKSS